MKRLLLLVCLSTLIICTTPKKEKCLTQEDCENMTSEYEKYRACMERRTKRSTDCYDEDSCDNCDCNTCSYNSCDSCSHKDSCCGQCCQSNACTTTNCCHQTCRAECRSNSCRTSCKKRCLDRTTQTQSSSQMSHRHESTSKHNITTVIHLNNVINNTNLINLPINVNNTVLNNITNEGHSGGGYFGSYVQGASKEQCCTTVGPRQCVPQNDFPFMRCFHVRRQTCGSMCTAPVVHYQKHEICDNDVNLQQPCRQQIVYIPQPQPRCAYQPTWPYVTCGNSQSQSCEGCYDHYIKREDLTKCSNFCYDDGYGAGPYYRQGPFYRPGFAHVPSCVQTGTCGYGWDGYEGYGGAPSGFPYMYPPQTYPYIIEDCENGTCAEPAIQWSGPVDEKSIDIKDDKNIQWFQPDKMMNIETEVKNSPRSGRYAEIRIKHAKKHKTKATTSTTVESSSAGTSPTTAASVVIATTTASN
ncbi:uncharacterized protein LOC103313601 [Tribolium castaneum]|uniref:Uncharacterized protein n=1 Tax=Tribolium castaneum TaxID=7070 RepID=D6WU49_TRICA|nr:PREDICTED: uncharacterized protein LOC103313601 [Tribolium castaneum]XP_015837012.1 PREDICTED: uncharacterized protein LOC103313601 [Tribolium castaneum]EFA06767.1 hypothetical protein TcasGA2_TC009701 [Tribolium castaneum]|eukprot:XP_008195498.1 PREDICTED: uncharacterized protein LOC103313601 [Tribolium castaneum]